MSGELRDLLFRMTAEKQSIKLENGRAHLTEQAPWLDELVREFMGFPGSEVDDQVDSTSQSLDYLERFAHLPILPWGYGPQISPLNSVSWVYSLLTLP